MKAILFVACSMVISVSAFSQKNKQNREGPKDNTSSDDGTYSMIRENTNISYFSIGADPIDMQIGDNFYMGHSISLDALLFQKIFLHSEYNYHYAVADIGSGNRIDGESIYKPTNSNDFELMAGYHFTRKVDGKVKIKLKQSGHTTYVAKVDAQYEKYWGIQAGIAKGVKLVYGTGTYNATDYYSNAPTSFQGEFSTYMDYTWFLIGGSLGKLIDVTGKFSNFGDKTEQEITRFYLDLMIPISTTLDDIYWNEGYGSSNPLYHRYQINNTVAKGKFGFRIGYTQNYYNKIISGGPELAFLPGIENPQGSMSGYNPYFRIKFQIGFNKLFERS